MSLSGIVRRVIDLARASSQEDESLWIEPRTGPVYSIDMMRPGPSTYRRELREYLLGHPVEVICPILVIMCVGSGVYSVRDLSLRCRRARAKFKTTQEAVNEMVGKAPLAEYLEEGLRLLANRGIDVDGLLEDDSGTN